jgi:general secretion pathway protein I
MRGFTLIEILIAFAILAVALAALFQAFSGGLDAIDRTDRATTSVLLARSLMDRVGGDIPLVVGTRAGDFENGFEWQVTLTPASADLAPPVTGQQVQLLQISVTVSSDSAAPVTLTTLRLAPAAPDGSQP